MSSSLIRAQIPGTALECYSCDPACEASKAQKKECGKTIGSSHEAVCTTEFPAGKDMPKEAIRKCAIVVKGQKPPCNADYECKSCNSDLCNAAPSVGGSAAMLGVVAAFFMVKLFY
ncbi:uncharacterized protein BDFB_006367 [Asbolus verrucosus]|uniref:Uncharacterized protein n=1 Tax=Asbolus verrucosus TaxID=1661398 RepID=A0A482VZJ7_ASBVE|nr:uncharacterized protein BDFB_006367 [Asbolus verrucosus]